MTRCAAQSQALSTMACINLLMCLLKIFKMIMKTEKKTGLDVVYVRHTIVSFYINLKSENNPYSGILIIILL